MTTQEIYNKYKNLVWNCHNGEFHTIGCPHKEWTRENLLEALCSKMKFEQSGLAGQPLTEELYQKIKVL